MLKDDIIIYPVPTVIVSLINSETGLQQFLLQFITIFIEFMNGWQHHTIKTDKQMVKITLN